MGESPWKFESSRPHQYDKSRQSGGLHVFTLIYLKSKSYALDGEKSSGATSWLTGGFSPGAGNVGERDMRGLENTDHAEPDDASLGADLDGLVDGWLDTSRLG